MGYIENNLMQDENLVHITRLHPIILALPAMATSFLAGVLSLVREEPYIFYPVAVLFVYSCIRMFSRLLFFITSEFGITSKRVLGKTGFIRRNALDIVLAKVEAVRLSQNVLGRVLNYGTVEVTGTGGTEEALDYIPDPLAFRNRIQEQLWIVSNQKGENFPQAIDG